MLIVISVLEYYVYESSLLIFHRQNIFNHVIITVSPENMSFRGHYSATNVDINVVIIFIQTGVVLSQVFWLRFFVFTILF